MKLVNEFLIKILNIISALEFSAQVALKHLEVTFIENQYCTQLSVINLIISV